MADKVAVYYRNGKVGTVNAPTIGEYVMSEMRFRVMVMDCLYQFDRIKATPTVDEVLTYCRVSFRAYCRG